MEKVLTAAIVLAACLSGSAAVAQAQPLGGTQGTSLVMLHPPDAARWDAAGHIGWLGFNQAELASGWDDWHDAGSIRATAGYYLTPHLKLEVEGAATNTARFFSYTPLPEFAPYGRTRDYQTRATTIGATAVYQLFENAWFHPFAGIGVDLARESIRYSSPPQLIPGPDGRLTHALPAEERGWESTTALRPAATVGFKWYATERVFVRSDVRLSFSSQRMESMVWHSGVGVDF